MASRLLSSNLSASSLPFSLGVAQCLQQNRSQTTQHPNESRTGLDDQLETNSKAKSKYYWKKWLSLPSVNALLEDIRFSYILLHMKQIILLIAIVLLLTACTKPARKTSGNTTQTSLSNMAVDRQIKESDSTGTERIETRQADTLSLQEDSIIRHPSHSIYGE